MKLLYILLILGLNLNAQNIVTSGYFKDSLGNQSTTLVKGFSKVVANQIITGKNTDTIFHQPYSIVKGYGGIQVIDTIDFYGTIDPDYDRKDSIIVFQKKFKLERVKTFGNIEYNSVGNPFLIDRSKTLIHNPVGNSFVARAYLNEQCKVKRITLNGVDFPTNNDFNGFEILPGEFRHSRLVNGLNTGANVIVVDYENEIGNISTAIFYVNTD